MSVTQKDIQHVAQLARIAVDEKDLNQYSHDLNNLLGLVEQMNEINTDEIEPMAHPLELSQRLRSDQVTEHNERALLQTNAPLTEQGFYLVPQVIE